MFIEFDGLKSSQRGEIINSETRLKKLAKKLMQVEEFAFDTETNTLRVQSEGEMELVGISICFGLNNSYYIPVGHYFDDVYQLPLKTVVKYLKKCFERKDVTIIGHNLKFDIHVLANVGIYIQTKHIFDTLVASHDINENVSKGLKDLTKYKYKVGQEHFDACLKTVTKEEKKEYGLKANQKAPFFLVRVDVAGAYAIADAFWTWRHYVDWELDELAKEEMSVLYHKIRMPFLWTLYKMERRGVNIDKEKLKKMQIQAQIDLDELEYKILELSGIEFNIGSSQQVGELLFGYMKYNKQGEYVGNIKLVENSYNFPIEKKTSTGAPSTGKEVLESLAKKVYKKDKRKREGVELIKLILKYKKLAKLKSTYMDGLLKQIYPDGRIHCTYNICGTDSGRLSSKEPNLQNLPRPVEMPSKPELKNCESKEVYNKLYKKYLKDKEEADFWKAYEIRDVFIADNEDDVLIACDYSNLEMRLLAHFSNDKNLVETFIKNNDAHGSTAVNMFALDCDPNKAKKLYKHLRQIAKMINFLLMYGGSAFTLFNELLKEDAVDENGDLITKEKSQEYYDAYFEAYYGVAEFIKNQKKYAHRHEFVYTVIGRKRRLERINNGDYKTIAYEERLSVNSAIQGSGGDIMMCCQPAIEKHKRLLELGCTQRLQVHDEIVFNCPRKHADEAIKIIKDLMENALPKPLRVPLKVDADTGNTYAEAK